MGELCIHCFQEKVHAGPCKNCGFDPTGQQEKYPQALPPNTILNGRYIIGHVLGQGGFGVTYIAQDYQTKERVAIKEYFPKDLSARTGSYRVTPYSGQRQQDYEFGKRRFLDEAETLAKFGSDPYIVNVYRYFEEESTQTAYFVMEYVDGLSLESYAKSKGGRLSPEETNSILIPIMHSLSEIHKHGIVHRDIAPDNILLTEDLRPKLIDFGAARSSTGNKSMSIDVVVKHGFAPKEQYSRHGKVGAFTDVYSMGASWYYCVTGRIPPDSIDRVEEDGLILPGTLGVKLMEEQLNALLKALAVSAEDRFQSMEEFAVALEPNHTTRENLVVRAFDYLEEGNWGKADSYLNTALDFEPENAMIYIGRLMARLHVAKQEELAKAAPFDQDPLYVSAMQCADSALKLRLESWANEARYYAEHEKLDELIREGMNAVKTGKWDVAEDVFVKALQIDPQSAEAHLGMLLAEYRVKKAEQLIKVSDIRENIHFAPAASAIDSEILKRIENYKPAPSWWKWIAPVGVLLFAALILLITNGRDAKYTLKNDSSISNSQYETLPNITIRPQDMSRVYDGTELKPIAYTVDGDLNGFAVEDVVMEGGQIEAGSSEAKVVSFRLYDPQGNLVSDKAIKKAGTLSIGSATLTVEKRPLIVTAVSAELVTDGENIEASSLNVEGFTDGFQVNGLLENQQISGDFVRGSGTQSFVSGVEENDIHIKDSNGADVTDSYEITTVPGTVEISIRPLSVIVAEDCTSFYITYHADKHYDGIRFAVWSDEGGQDDLLWYDAKEQQKNLWDQQIELKKHRSAGLYYVHTYSTGNSGDSLLETRDFFVEKAIIPETHLEVERLGQDLDTVLVVLKSKESFNNVMFPVWSDDNGQDDLVWYPGEKNSDGEWTCTFRLSNHPGSLRYIHAYEKTDQEEVILDGITRYWVTRTDSFLDFMKQETGF